MDKEQYIPSGGFIVARKAFESDLWRKKPSTWLKVWFYIIGSVQHSNYKELRRGEGYFNFSEIARMKYIGDDVTINNVEKFLIYARRAEMLATRKATHGVVVSVLNYDLYQDLNNYVAEQKAETWAEPKRNGSGDINKYEKKENKNHLLNEPAPIIGKVLPEEIRTDLWNHAKGIKNG